MALSDVNVHIVAALNDAGLASVGMCGADADVASFRVGRRTLRPRRVRRRSVNRGVIDALWSAGLTPVVNPVALDKNAEPLNCNADAVAGALAGGAGRRRARALERRRSTARRTSRTRRRRSSSVTGARDRKSMKRSGAVRDGMTPKVDGGARRARRGRRDDPAWPTAPGAHALRDALARTIPTTEVVR